MSVSVVERVDPATAGKLNALEPSASLFTGGRGENGEIFPADGADQRGLEPS
jgi:hypothetical protein